MSFEIQELDEKNFILNGDVKSKSFRAFGDGDYISIKGDGCKIKSITNGSYVSNFITKDAGGLTLFDGSSGASVNDLVISINSIVNFT